MNILLIDITFYLLDVPKLVFIVLIKNKQTNIIGTGG